MTITPETFLNEWSAKGFYNLVLFLSWESHYQNEYQKIVSAKIGK